MMQIKRCLSNYSFYLYIAILGCLVVIPICFNYRFLKDDTANVVQFLGFINQYDMPRLLSFIGSNEWLGYQPRSFFLTWWIQIGLIKLFGMNNLLEAARLPFALFIGLIHIINAMMLFRASKRFLNIHSSLVIALGYLVFPWATVDYLVSNNWFFILPLFFYLLFVNAILYLEPLKIFTLVVLIVLLLCTMFSGEQMIAVPYMIGLVINLYIFIYYPDRHKKIQLILQSCLVYGSGIILFLVYSKLIVSSPVPIDKSSIWGKNIFNVFELINTNTPIVIYNYVLATRNFIGRFLPLHSNLYGGVSFSAVSIGLGCIFSVGAAIVLRKSAYRWIDLGKGYPFWLKLTVLLAGLIGVMLPMFFGAITGARPGPDDRYLMVPALFVFGIIVLLFERSILDGQYKKLALLLVVAYFSFLTFHISWDLWRAQGEVDKRLWAAVLKTIDNNPDYILTINNDPYHGHRGLERPYLSLAWTDFQADWGVTNRLRYDYGYEVKLIHYVEPAKDGGLFVIDYWGGRYKTKPEKIQVIYLNDTAKLLDSLSGKLELLSFDDYLLRVKSNSIPNRLKIN